MKKDILQRYDFGEDGVLLLKISAKKIEDLYNYFDKESSFAKKDLNDELVAHIIESVSEIGNHPFVLQFYLEERVNEELRVKIKNSMEQYFFYLQDLEKKKMKEQIKNSFIFMAIGIFFTTISLLNAEKTTFVQKVISEGLMVAGWVSLWEALATFLIRWLPLSKKLKLYKKVALCSVEFIDSVKR